MQLESSDYLGPDQSRSVAYHQSSTGGFVGVPFFECSVEMYSFDAADDDEDD